MKQLFLLCYFLFVLLSCGTYKPSFKGTPFQKHKTLEGIGFTQVRLDTLTKFLNKKLSTTGMIIIKDGKILYEYGDITELSYIASCRKSVASMLYGKYVENGTIDLNETIGSIGIDEKDGLTLQEKEATVRDIISSRSGVFHTPANGGSDVKNIIKRDSVKHGEYFVYNNWDYNVAGYILEKKSGNSIYKELEEQLAIPLEFQDWNIKNQKKKWNKKKSNYAAYHMYLSARDMAKIGLLMLNNGKWNDKQLISKDWIKKITTTVTPTETINKRKGLNSKSPYQLSYGYMWWLIDSINHHPDFEGAYSATGYGGQFITVIPKLNMVVVHKTKLGIQNYLGLKYDVSNAQYWKLLYDFIATKKVNISQKNKI